CWPSPDRHPRLRTSAGGGAAPAQPQAARLQRAAVPVRPGREAGPTLDLPALRLALVLLVQPRLQRGKVFEHCRRTDLAAASEGLQRVRPRLACAHFEHGVKALAHFLVTVEAAAVQRPAPPSRIAS